MQDWMSRDIVQGTAIAEKIDGAPEIDIYTHHYPILEFTSLAENETALVEDTDYESLAPDLEFGRIVRLSSGNPMNWITGRRNIELTYDHGYVNVPGSLVTAATAMVVVEFFDSIRGKGWRGLASKNVDPGSAGVYDKDVWERQVIPAMQPFLKWVV